MLNKKYIGIFISSLLLAVGSMAMLKAVQTNNVPMTMLWEAAGPFLYLLYNHYMIEAKNFKTRVIIAAINAVGLAIGSGLSILIMKML